MNLWLIIGLIFLIGILILLTVPWRIRLNGWADPEKGLSYWVSLDWALGAVRVSKAYGRPWRLHILGLPVAHFAHFPVPKGKRKKKKEKKSSPLAFAGIIKRNHHTMIRILGRMARAAFLEGHVKGRIGLPDPADTAQIAMLLRLARLPSRRFNLYLDWVYVEAMVQIHANISATLIFGYLLLSVGMLLFDRQTRMMLHSLRHA